MFSEHKKTSFLPALIVVLALLTGFFVPDNAAVAADSWGARVVSVADGDTITVEPAAGGDRVKVRLWGIDAPESKQPYGQAAKGFVNNAVLFKRVSITPVDKDRYGRTVALVTLDNGAVLQEVLLLEGLAWVYRDFCKRCGNWIEIERQAIKGGKGLWTDKSPTPPWEWRKQNRLR
jgi:endonuclease YncB( thermonuclease family)